MSRHTIKIVILFGTLAIIGIFIGQLYFIYNSYQEENRKFDQSVRIVLQNVAEKLSSYHETPLPYEKIIRRYSSDYYLVNVNTIIDVKILEYYLIKEFETQNIITDFEYAIYDCSTDKMVYGNYVNLSETKGKESETKVFPKCNDYIYYFGIYFPHQNKYIVSNLSVWYFITGILIIVVVFFAYSIIIILRQKRLSEIQKDFIHNITHELKTPLTTISLSANVISEKGILDEPERLSKYASIIKEQSVHLHEQVIKVLQYSNSEKLRANLNKSRLCLNTVINEIINSFEPRFSAENVKLTLDLPKNDIYIYADEIHLKNTIYNIIDNAIKYSEKGPEIEVKLYLKKHLCFISIKDKGMGISKKYQSKVFEKFFRVPTGNIHNVKGFGIGLSYVKNVVKSHKWKIKMTSAPGTGTEILITINKNMRK